MKIDLDYLQRAYFTFDEPVPYQLQNKETICIRPVGVKDSAVFLSCVDILALEKNNSNDVAIIQMSYLDFLLSVVAPCDKQLYQKLVSIFVLCLGVQQLDLFTDDNGHYCFKSDLFSCLTRKDFDNIRRIILYQNILHYDDEYVNPDLQAAMNDVNKLKNKNIDYPNLERRIAIITAHCGLPKAEQLKMSMRSHTALFNEIRGEVDFLTLRPIALYAGQDKGIDWICPQKKGKFDGYFVDEQQFNKQMGGNGKINQIESSHSQYIDF